MLSKKIGVNDAAFARQCAAKALETERRDARAALQAAEVAYIAACEERDLAISQLMSSSPLVGEELIVHVESMEKTPAYRALLRREEATKEHLAELRACFRPLFVAPSK